MLINQILPVLRRLLLLPPFYPHPEPAALPLFRTNSKNKSTVDWLNLVTGFCFAVGVGLLSCPISFASSIQQLPGFWSSVGLLSASAALFTALSIPLTDDLKPVLWSVYSGLYGHLYLAINIIYWIVVAELLGSLGYGKKLRFRF